MDQNNLKLNLAWNQFLSVFLLACWVFFISFSSIKSSTPDIAIFMSFVPVAIIASCFWFDYKKSGVFLLASSLTMVTLTGIGVKYCQHISAQKRKVRKYKKAKYRFKKLKAAINTYRYKYLHFPNPTSSGNKQTTKFGSHTLQKVLSRPTNGIAFFNRFPNAHLDRGVDASFVCVVAKASHYKSNQSKYTNCITDHLTKLPDTYKQGYVYHPQSGKIRYNFKTKRPKVIKGFFNFLDHYFFSK
ncbi:MAG: hypothetical protein KC646_07185 [Candidatus Cloacimonetes bacterium]|nr:hypothetical protein [Candidatus Cloacimonadota bacterium]